VIIGAGRVPFLSANQQSQITEETPSTEPTLAMLSTGLILS